MLPEESGFTLLETMVAFVLMALSVAVLMQAFSGGGYLLASAGEQSRAASIARSQLERLGREWPLEEGVREGEWGRYRWQILLEPFEPAGGLPENPAGRLLRVTLTVHWRAGGRERRFRVTSLRLASP